jgi:hypothetical protein
VAERWTEGRPDVTDTRTAVASGLRRWWALLTAVVVTAGVVGYAVHDREQAEQVATGGIATVAPTPKVQAADVDGSARSQAIDTILAQRAAAIMAVDEQSFLAAVDATQARLVAAQRMLFANLVDVGLEYVRYDRRQDQPDQAMLDRYGPTAYPVRIAMTYEIKGIDPEPVRTELGYTFAERNGRWLLVDDSSLDAGLTPGAHREPWDLSRVEIQRSPRLMVLVDKGQTTFGRSVTAQAEQALATVDKYWPGGWRGSVLVSATAQERVRGADFTSTDIDSSASATGTYRSLPGEQTKEGVFAGAYVVVNPAQHNNVDEILLSHEFTHVATAALGGYEPLWLAEGVAEYVSWKGVEEISGPDAVADGEADVQRNALPRMTSLPSDTGFYTSHEDVYGVSWLAVRFLIRRIGITRLVEMYKAMARDGWNEAARGLAMTTYTGLTEQQLFTALKTYQPVR